MDLAIVMTLVCIIFCFGIFLNSWRNKNKGIIDSGAQNVVTIGVLFTFIGIAIGLYNFDPSADKMGEQLDIFLGGMKTAFWTSIVGMISGIIIKFIQSGAERKEDESVKENLSAINLTKNAVDNNTSTLLAALNGIKERIDANGNAQLQMNLNQLVTAMETFVDSSDESRSDMKDLSVRMSNQAKMLERLSDTLTKSIEDFGEKQRENLAALSNKIIESGDKQAQRFDDMNQTIAGQSTVLQQLSDTLTKSIEDLGEKQRENLAALSDKIIESGNEQSKRLDDMNKTIAGQSTVLQQLSDTLTKSIEDLGEKQRENLEALSDKIIESGNEQAQRLDKMNQTIDKMLTATETAQKNSQELLDESKAYQQQSLANDKEQAQILTENTNQIAAMKEAFDKFLQNMAENYSKELINALALSMEKLNTQLQEQFGDNFKELNAAVKDVVKWQENYKETVELTTDELKHINQVFTEFTQTISVEVDKHIEALATNLQTFGESTDKNVDVQKDLRDAVIQICDAVEQSKASVKQMQAMTASFGQFSEDVLKTNNDALEEYNNTVKGKFFDLNNALQNQMQTMTEKFGQFNDEVLKTNKDALEDYNGTVKGKFSDLNNALQNQMQTMTEKFGQFNDEVLKTNKDALDDYNNTVKEKFSDLNDAIEEIVGAFVASVTTLQGTALNLTVEVENYLRDFGDASKDVMENIRKKLEDFNNDFSTTTTESVKDLRKTFEEIAKNTDKQSDIAIKTLAGALGRISDQMIENYNALIQRIAELDKIIREGGHKS